MRKCGAQNKFDNDCTNAYMYLCTQDFFDRLNDKPKSIS